VTVFCSWIERWRKCAHRKATVELQIQTDFTFPIAKTIFIYRSPEVVFALVPYEDAFCFTQNQIHGVVGAFCVVADETVRLAVAYETAHSLVGCQVLPPRSPGIQVGLVTISKRSHIN